MSRELTKSNGYTKVHVGLLSRLMNLNYLVCCFGLVKNSGFSASRETLCQCVLRFSMPFPFLTSLHTHTTTSGYGNRAIQALESCKPCWAEDLLSSEQKPCSWVTLTCARQFYLDGNLNHSCDSGKPVKYKPLMEAHFHWDLQHFGPASNRLVHILIIWVCAVCMFFLLLFFLVLKL